MKRCPPTARQESAALEPSPLREGNRFATAGRSSAVHGGRCVSCACFSSSRWCVLIPFVLWGGRFEAWFTGDAAVAWLRGLGAWGWLGGIGLLMADLFLPVPGTAVMSALGFFYGPWIGGRGQRARVVPLGGSLAYGLTRWIDPRWAATLAGEAEMKKYHALFARSGAWIVALSRWLPRPAGSGRLPRRAQPHAGPSVFHRPRLRLPAARVRLRRHRRRRPAPPGCRPHAQRGSCRQS